MTAAALPLRPVSTGEPTVRRVEVASRAAQFASNARLDNRKQRKGLRLVQGEPRLVVIGEGFVVVGMTSEQHAFDAFVERITNILIRLATQFGMQITELEFHQPDDRPPRVAVEMVTPAFYYPKPTSFPTES